jgi:hypothetical protein
MSKIVAAAIESLAAMTLRTNSTDRVTVTSEGLVGVGTNAPTSLLHVAGTANITSSVTLGGTLNVGGLATLAGATSSAIISCGTAPTLGQHLTNKTYVDTSIGIGSIIVANHDPYSPYTVTKSSTILTITATANGWTISAPAGQVWHIISTEIHQGQYGQSVDAHLATGSNLLYAIVNGTTPTTVNHATQRTLWNASRNSTQAQISAYGQRLAACDYHLFAIRVS